METGIKLGILCFVDKPIDVYWEIIKTHINEICYEHSWGGPSSVIYCGPAEYERKIKDWANSFFGCIYTHYTIESPRTFLGNLSSKKHKTLKFSDDSSNKFNEYINSNKRSSFSIATDISENHDSRNKKILRRVNSSYFRKKSPRNSPRDYFENIIPYLTNVIIFSSNKRSGKVFDYFNKHQISCKMISLPKTK